MRGTDVQQGGLFSYVSVEDRIPANHPLRAVRALLDEALAAMSRDFDRVYAISDEDLDRSDTSKTSAVHFMRFEFPPAQVAALKSGASLIAGIDHENYAVEICPVADNIRESLINDLN